MKTLIAAAVALLVFGTGAAQDAGLTPNTTPVLHGSQWQLVSIDTADGRTPVVAGSEVTLDIAATDLLNGSSGCNTYSGPYTVEGNSFTVGAVATTRMACADEALSAQENAYLTALQSAVSFQVSGSRLTLTAADGQMLRFTARGAFALIGSQWQLTAYGPSGAETAVESPDPVTLDFTGATEFSASGGCNGLGSTYTADDESLTLEPGASTLMACDGDVMVTEQAYFALLPTVTAYDISGDRLTLTTEDGQLLHFTAAGKYALTRTEWVLDSITSVDEILTPLEGSTLTLQFGADGTAGGSAGCNQFGGSYKVEDGSLTFSEIVSTLMACVDEHVMAQEARYLEALNQVTGYEIADGTLILYKPDGQIEFSALGDPIAPDEA